MKKIVYFYIVILSLVALFNGLLIDLNVITAAETSREKPTEPKEPEISPSEKKTLEEEQQHLEKEEATLKTKVQREQQQIEQKQQEDHTKKDISIINNQSKNIIDVNDMEKEEKEESKKTTQQIEADTQKLASELVKESETSQESPVDPKMTISSCIKRKVGQQSKGVAAFILRDQSTKDVLEELDSSINLLVEYYKTAQAMNEREKAKEYSEILEQQQNAQHKLEKNLKLQGMSSELLDHIVTECLNKAMVQIIEEESESIEEILGE